VAFGTGPWGFYLLYAGYYGLSQQAGALGGLTLPVSFDRPFRSTNLSDFWARWNMSATAVFRDALFFNRWGLRVANLYLNTLLVFLAVGLWHAVNGYWALWGLMHGVGFCVFIAWKRWRGPRARPLPWPAGWALTYVFVCSCWLVPPQVLKFLNWL
jgi:D-alanyl-lipoteichoic acid acyltransferase DltB (MBOAT superfamily)